MEDPSRRRKKEKKDKKRKKSEVRTKFLIESKRKDYFELREENDRLREIIQTNLPKNISDAILADCFDLTAHTSKALSIDDLAGTVIR